MAWNVINRKTFTNLSETHKKILFSLAIFFIVFFIQGLFFCNWGVGQDDYGPLWHSKVTSLQDFFKLFYASDNFSILFPSNYHPHSQTFCSVIYRPLSRVFFAPQVHFFQANPLGYFLTMIFFHALNAVLLFNIFSIFTTSYIMATWGALFFAFHCSVAFWMGWICAQSYTYGLTLILLSLIFFFLHLKSNRWSLYIASGLSYLVALFSLEHTIVFPATMLSLGLMQDFIICYFPYPKLSLQKYFQKTLLFWAVACSYLATRFFLYPIQQDPLVQSFFSDSTLSIIKGRGYGEIMTFFADLANISFFSSHYHYLKISLFLAIICLITMLFKKSRLKGPLIIMAFNMLLFMWPAIIRCFYRPRHIYFLLPFFTMALLMLLGFCKKHRILSINFSGITSTALFCFLGLNCMTLITTFKYNEAATHTIFQAYEEFAQNPRLHNRVLCFVGLPLYGLSGGLAQGFWLRNLNTHLPIYYDLKTFVTATPTQDPGLTITPIKNGFRLTLINKQEYGFAGDINSDMGQHIIHGIDPKTGHVYDKSFIIDEQYRKQNMLFIGWDYKKLRFTVLGSYREMMA